MAYSGTDLTGEVHVPWRVNQVNQVLFAICTDKKINVFVH